MANMAQTQGIQRFIVRLSGVSAVTGSGTIYTSVYDSTVQGSGVVLATGVFTCTVSGTFLFCGCPSSNNLGSTYTMGAFNIVTTQRTYQPVVFSPGGWRSTALIASQGVYCIAPMNTGDTASMTIQISNGAVNGVGLFDWLSAVRLF